MLLIGYYFSVYVFFTVSLLIYDVSRDLFLFVLGGFVGVLHYYHVKTLYENDRHFSHLSNIEREMCFRSEMVSIESFFQFLILFLTLFYSHLLPFACFRAYTIHFTRD